MIVGYGFWIFLLSDIIMFSAFFAAYAVLQNATAGGPSGGDLFRFAERRDRDGLPALLELHLRAFGGRRRGAPHDLDAGGAVRDGPPGPGLSSVGGARVLGNDRGRRRSGRSAFLSSFFALVGCHGAHVSVGLLWLGTMMAQLEIKGFRADIERRLLCFNLFWHMLDIVWVAIFTLVYLVGGAR